MSENKKVDGGQRVAQVICLLILLFVYPQVLILGLVCYGIYKFIKYITTEHAKTLANELKKNLEEENDEKN